MSKRFYVDDTVTNNGKYRVLQEDSVTKERFGVKDFDTREEAQQTANDMQRAVNNALSENVTLRNIDISPSSDNSLDNQQENRFKDTLQDLKTDTSQE
jgi:hypothetical protein